jgi:ribonuclease P protein component
MLTTNRRIKKESFGKIMKDGLFLSSKSFNLRLLSTQDTSLTRFAFVVSTKVNKTSVGRHLIKRRMSAVVENLLISLKPGFLALFLVKKDVSTLPYKELTLEITEILKKAKILNEETI